MSTIKVMLLPDQKRPERECKPADQLTQLINTSVLSGEDFHEIGILAALGRANADSAWYFVNGMCDGQLRYWLESDGWAIECGETEALITPADFYYESRSVTQLRRYTPPEVADRIVTAEGRMALGVRTQK